jgi:hypothetical protein
MTKSTPASEDALNALHTALVEALAQRIANGEASAADLSVAAKLLKDNNITAVRTPDSPLDKLANTLPFPSEDGVYHEQETQH